MDLASVIRRLPFAPPLFSESVLTRFAHNVDRQLETAPSQPAFTCARKDESGRRMPQAIAHRGYRAKFPENSLVAFEAAIEAGAHAVETDLHLTRDKVVVLSHDGDLKRCFGVDWNIKDCDWDELRHLRTIEKPEQPLGRLAELLNLLSQPKSGDVWVMLDIKIDDDSEDLLQYTSDVLKYSEKASGVRWKERTLLGLWTAKSISIHDKYFPGYAVANECFSAHYSRQFLPIKNMNFSVLQQALVSPSGRKFLRDIKALDRRVYSWTVNDELNMLWCLRHRVDGVITDDVVKFLAICKRFRGDEERWIWPVKSLLGLAYFNLWIWLFGLVLSRRRAIKHFSPMMKKLFEGHGAQR